MPEGYTGARSTADIQFIQTWYADSENYATLYYEPAERRFKLRYVGDQGIDRTVGTTPRFFQRAAMIRLGMRFGPAGFGLSIRDGSVRGGNAVEHFGDATVPAALLGRSLATATGDTNGDGILPEVRVEHVWYGTSLTDEEMTAALSKPGYGE